MSLATPLQTDLPNLLSTLTLPGADWIGLRRVTETSTIYSARDEKPQVNGRSTSSGVMIEVLYKGQFGYAATNQLDESSLRATAVRAFEQARAASAWAVHPFTDKERPASKGRYETKVSKGFSTTNVRDLTQLLTRLCGTLKVSDKVVKTSAAFELVETEFEYLSTTGADLRQSFSFVGVDLEAVAKEGSIIQKRTNHGARGVSRQGGLEFLEAPDLLARAEMIGRQAVELLTAEDCPSETTTLVLAPDQMMLQIHESIGHPLELDRILGDERNYAGSSFVNLSDFGSLQYGSKLLNVTFDPTLSTEFASYGFDDSGVPATREFLIKEGRLLRGLGSLESQKRSGVPGVANYRSCSWNRAPIDRMANINLEPGATSFENLISGIERGVFMESNRSWSIDDYRNKFQFGCEYARLIEGGKLTRTVRNPNYRGTTNSFWHNLIGVGAPETLGVFGTPYCGKGEPNQVLRVGHASPACVFGNVEVFGGGE